MNPFRCGLVVALVCAYLGMSAATSAAAQLLQLDINGLAAEISPADFGADYTGTLTLSSDGNSELAWLLIDGAPQSFVGTLTSLSGTIQFLNGEATGGQFTLVIGGDTVTANIVPSGAPSILLPGINTTVIGLTSDTMFTGAELAGVDIGPWHAAAPLNGYFTLSDIQFDAGVDADVNLDLVAIVPEPATAGMVVLLSGILITMRRRVA